MAAKIMIIAGEASGDLHGGKLVQALRAKDPLVKIFGVGGDHMQAGGMELLFHVNQLGYVGFTEVARHLFFFRQVFDRLLAELRRRKPDVLILIDYPGFNLRFGKAAKKLETKVFYYIAPQVWAWHQSRAQKMAGFIDRMAVIFDFEVPFFRQHGIETTFVGHPLLEGLSVSLSKNEFCAKHDLVPEQPLLALLPGSRHQEVEYLLPGMVETAGALCRDHPGLQVAVSKAATINRLQIEKHLGEQTHIKIIEASYYELLKFAAAAIVASGTATLEAACFEIPFAIVYRVSPLSYAIGKRVVKIPYISLANIVAGEGIVKEFIQDKVTIDNLRPEMEHLLFDPAARTALIDKLKTVKIKLGTSGASGRTAELILEMARNDWVS
jgi:lipid-A-disaccharide synthase